jgi:PST family polysaccharide transporter
MIPFDASGAFHPLAEDSKLRNLAVRGAATTVSASGLSLAVGVISTVILARLLTPADFGVVTMATTFSLLAASFGLDGFTEAVIQCKEIDHGTASNLFWLNSLAGLVLAIAFAGTGSLLARFYGNPLVTHIAVGLSVGIFIASLSVIPLALLKRAMRFAATSANDVGGRLVITAVSIVLAFSGWGYWALVAGIVAQQLSITVGAWWLCRWVPSLPKRTGKTRAMVWFAAKVYGQFTLGYATLNLDNLLVGWRFNAVALGYYKKAYDLFALTASQLTAPLNHVALAALSRLNHDPVRFRRCLAGSLSMVALVGMAASADLTLVGKDVIRLVLGPQWSVSGTIFELLGPGIGALLLYSTIGWVHLSVGKPERWLRWTVVQLITTACFFLIALPWGPQGIAVAWSVSYWLLIVPAFWYAGQPVGFGPFDFIAAVGRYAAAALLAGLATAGIFRTTPFWATAPDAGAAFIAIIVMSAVFISLYLGAIILLYGGMAPLHQLESLLHELPLSRRWTKRAAEALGEYK